MRELRTWRIGIVSCILLATSVCGQASDRTEKMCNGLAKHRSRHFVMHTDLCRTRAQATLQRMETTLKWVSNYWGRSLREPVECYVIDELTTCPDRALPNPITKVLLRRVGGGTDLETYRVGRRERYRPRIYATADRGTAEHEVVHAYCGQVFGAHGPDWYKEGMAQVAGLGANGGRGVVCPGALVEYLHSVTPRSVEKIVQGDRFTAPIAASLDRLAKSGTKDSDRPSLKVSQNRWHRGDDEILRKAWNDYCWSWSICHLLSHHTRYKDRFKRLGRGFVTRQEVDFGKTFAAVADQIEFEHRFFVKHFDQGYRVDLCQWEWDTTFSPIANAASVRVHAARGFQPTGALVAMGEVYAYTADGTWSTRADDVATTADGDASGKGRLVGVVLADFTLSKPIELGAGGTFVAPCHGQLFFRCRDAWPELSDNRGAVDVRITRAATPRIHKSAPGQ